MPKTNAMPRPVGVTVLSLLAIALATLVLPSASVAAPDGAPLLKLSPSPATFPNTTAGFQSQTQELDVVNEGDADAWVETIVVEGTDSNAFNLGGSSCGFVQPGQHCSVWVSFVPADPGEKQAVLSFHLSGFPEQSFALSGTAFAPQLTFTPAGHDFGIQQINRGSSTQFQLANIGEAAVQLGNLEIFGGSNAFWTGSSDCWGRWLQPGESCSMEVSFGPRDPVDYEAELRANVNGYSFSADLEGRGGQPVVEASENPADFGAGTVGTAGPVHTIALTNSGDLPAGFFIGIVAGGDAGSFRLLDESCSGEPLMPGASCAVHVRFTPQSAGPKVARLAFFGETEGGTMVALSGEGLDAAVTLAPSGFDFGSQAAGARSAAHSFAVRNDGTAPLDLGGVALTGADPDQFLLAGDECTGATLAPGAECQVGVRFAPDGAGAKTARLRVGSDAGAFTASLAGLGTAAAPAVDSRPAAGHPAGRASGRHHRFRNRFRRGWAIDARPRHRNLTRARAASPRG